MTGRTPARAVALGWRPRLTFRTRLTLTFTGMLALIGALMVVAVAVFMRTVPTYSDALVMGTTAAETTDAGWNSTPVDVSGDDTVMGTTAPSSTGSMEPLSATISLRSSADILDASLQVSLLVLLALVIVGAVVAWLVAGRMLRPLQSVNDAARLAGTGSFDHRLSLGGPRDELRDLADTVDDMLGKLDRAFGASDRFAANASHELRTPLAATQTMLEVALADPDAGIDDLRETARRVLETNRRGIETVEALLDLSELEHREPVRAPVPLDALVREVLRECDDERARRGIAVTTELDGTMIAIGDAVLLRQAVGNLVRNAIRHNIVGGEVRITALGTDAATGLRIENTGQQLTPEAVASFAEPFVRGAGRVAGSADEARGHGLGLAIVESVAHAHDGELRLAARDGGGLIAELELPR